MWKYVLKCFPNILVFLSMHFYCKKHTDRPSSGNIFTLDPCPYCEIYFVLTQGTIQQNMSWKLRDILYVVFSLSSSSIWHPCLWIRKFLILKAFSVPFCKNWVLISSIIIILFLGNHNTEVWINFIEICSKLRPCEEIEWVNRHNHKNIRVLIGFTYGP